MRRSSEIHLPVPNVKSLAFDEALEQLLVQFFQSEFVVQAQVGSEFRQNRSIIAFGERLLNVRQDVFVRRFDEFYAILPLNGIVQC